MRTADDRQTAGLTHAGLCVVLLVAAEPSLAQEHGLGLEEIVVTARKRDESLLRTPVSVTAFTRAALEARKVTDLAEVAAFTPNVEFDFTAPISGSTNSAAAFIRGVGQTDYVPSKDPGVGIYLDGVYITRTVGGVLNLLDVERVEILRGPQGTLFGKNTVGGAINVITARPGDVFSGEIDVTLGSYDRADMRASVDTPLSDELSARWSLGYFSRDGHMRRVIAGDRAGNDREYVGRVSLRWQPDAGFSADLSLDYSRADEEGTASKLLSTDMDGPYSIGELSTIFAGQAYNVLIGAPGVGASTIFPFLPPLPAGTTPYDRRWLTESPFETNATGPNYSEHSVFGVGATMTWSLPRVTVKSITAFRKTDANFGRDPDGSPLVIGQSEIWTDHQQTSQELQFSGERFGKRLDWVGGLYFMTETGKQRDFVPFVDETFRIYAELGEAIPNFLLVGGPFSVNSIDSLAAFGEASYALSDRLELTAGLRWTLEDRETVGNVTQGGEPTTANPRAALDDTATTGRIILSYAWNGSLMGYASYSEGFKSGGFNHRLPKLGPGMPIPGPTGFAPEELSTWELGLKASPAGGRVHLGTALFHSKYTNIQVLLSDLGVPRTVNAAAGEIDGLEFEIDVAASEAWRLNMAYGYLDARFTRLDDEIPGVSGALVEMPLTLHSNFVNTPEHSFMAGAEGTFRPRAGTELRFRVDGIYRSEISNDAVNTPELVQDALWLFRADLTLVLESCRCELSLFGENLTDAQYIVSGVGASLEGGFAEAIMARPREWGLRASYRFD